MAKIKKPTIKIILRKDKKLASGKSPVMLRVTFNRKQKYYVLKGENNTLLINGTKILDASIGTRNQTNSWISMN